MIVGIASADYLRSDRSPTGQEVWGGSGWARLGQYVHHFRAAGHHVVCGVAWNENNQYLSVEDENQHRIMPDIVILQRVMHDGVAKTIRAARSAGQVVINDLDDWYWGLDPSNDAFAASHPKVNLTENIRFYGATLAASDLLTVSTPYLADRISTRVSCPIVIIPNYVDVDRFTPVVQSEGTPLVGWAGSTSHRSGDIESIRGVIRPLVNAGTIRLHHSGDNQPHSPSFASKIGLDPEQVSTTPRSVFADYPKLLHFDIGLVPLRDTPFNRAKCLDRSTRVPTNRGIIMADQIMVGDAVSSDGTFQTVMAVEHTATRPGLQIEVEGGQRITVTLEHRLWEPMKQAFVEAQFLSVGDSLMLQQAATSPSMEQVPWPSMSRMQRKVDADHTAYQTAESGPRLTVDQRWGRLLGAFAGDGSLSGKTVVRIHCDGIDQDWIAQLEDDFRQAGFAPMTEQHTMFGGKPLRVRSVSVASSELVRTLTMLGLTQEAPTVKGIKRRVAVPEVIWRSPPPVVREFLSAYFEADGSVGKAAVTLTSKDEQIIRDVQTLLITVFGIPSIIGQFTARSQTSVGQYWKLRLNRAGVDRFYSSIGFQSSRKQARLVAIAVKPHSNAYRPSNYVPKIVAISSVMVENPVDIQVGSGFFNAAGIRSHNSDIKGLEYAAAGIPFIAAESPSYRALWERWSPDPGFFVARRADGWSKGIRTLLDYETRVKYQSLLLERVRGRHIDFGVNQWLDLLEHVVDKGI